MSTKSISISNLETGEVFDTNIRLNDDKFMARGYKMYNDGVIRLFTALTKTEAIKAIELFDEKTVDRFNILVGKFSDYTSEMHKTDRSKFKKKLIDNEIIQEFNKKIMLNPYIFIPKGDKNLKNSNYLTQRVWNYLFLDCDGKSEEIERHAKLMFGENIFLESEYIKVGSKDHSKIIKKPQPN